MRLIEFVFSSFWHFLGFAIILIVVFDGLVAIIKAIRKNPNSEVEKTIRKNEETWQSLRDEISAMPEKVDREEVLYTLDAYIKHSRR